MGQFVASEDVLAEIGAWGNGSQGPGASLHLCLAIFTLAFSRDLGLSHLQPHLYILLPLSPEAQLFSPQVLIKKP